ncbi:fucolectin-like [Misgurnus anguillicaudatus]|uniref:fucolectin-like n=1 Tax=Misgurnus anguillicaudatus TaxID=75329 RepID=UPI003CCF1D0C
MCNYCLFTLGMDVYSQTNPSSQVNLALRGRAVQSSTGYGWVAANAIDTSIQTCTHSGTYNNPWWRVDLWASYNISRVVITNRKDCCVGRLKGAEIHIGNSLEKNGNNNSRCAVLNDIPLGQSLSVSCHNMEGRYVNLIIPGSSKVLSVCKVEVYTKVLKKTFVMMTFLSSVNMTDPAVNDTILDQLKTALTSKGVSNVTLTWTKLKQVEPEIKMDDDEKSMCEP